MVKSLAQAKSLASAWNFNYFSQTIAVSISAYTCTIKKKQKNTNNHYYFPISDIILVTSKLEAILENVLCSLKLVKSSVSGGGGGGDSFAPLSTCLVSRYSLRLCMMAPCHFSISVSFSFSTFLCFAASWTGVDKKYSHYLCRTLSVFVLFVQHVFFSVFYMFVISIGFQIANQKTRRCLKLFRNLRGWSVGEIFWKSQCLSIKFGPFEWVYF